ncbi:type II toxin-antitoxin system MqsR family toxin [Amnimonas aquatica]|uniref:Motility quorum-sensing regulator MqsR n=1 Tax=Amnimonas aquatica TaxID=2094561 RepID=A0A2P6AQD1_9GAMM|nr:type II toxin-antitoxin system MqsR family toxin [Amnimonas aquatica]PQA30015.1 motility quorum-sensing regulator MqsR [Amnimonas aquatica]
MEKRIAHYKLSDVQGVVARNGIDSLTRTAQMGADAMGLNAAEAVAVVLSLTPSMLYKSMTTHADHRVWQDVYRAACPNDRMAYIKLTLRDGAVVIQFKEL